MRPPNRSEERAVEPAGELGNAFYDVPIEQSDTPKVGSAEATAIRQQLERLLESPHLRNSRRCQALLRFVVEAHLDGHLDKVKERCIGFEVFQRDADYDTSQDSVVRTAAAEVRKRLAQYYLEPEHTNEIRFVLPNGAYSPEFHFPGQPFPAVAVDERVEDGPSSPRSVVVATPRRLPRRRLLFAGLGLAGAILAGAACWYFWPSDFDRFWMPVLQGRAPVVICIEEPASVFRFNGPRRDELDGKMIGTGQTPALSREARESTSLKLSELTAVGGQYFSTGDLIATTLLTEMLAGRGRPFIVMGDRLTSYYELRGKPVILLGQLNNQWTQGLTGTLRYSLEKDSVSRRYLVRDRQNGGKIIASTSVDDRGEELAIVSRVFNVSTETTVVSVVAATHVGTLSAGGFLTNPAYMRRAWQGAQKGWYKKNIEVVLQSTTLHSAPAPPRVLATYFW